MLVNLPNAGVTLGFWLFQFMFATATATIVSGAIAERIKFQGYTVYSVIMIGFIYPVVAHWIFAGEGWLSAFKADSSDAFFDVGLLDFAGSGVVHLTGGVSSFVGCIMLGYRNQYVTGANAARVSDSEKDRRGGMRGGCGEGEGKGSVAGRV